MVNTLFIWSIDQLCNPVIPGSLSQQDMQLQGKEEKFTVHKSIGEMKLSERVGLAQENGHSCHILEQSK